MFIRIFDKKIAYETHKLLDGISFYFLSDTKIV